MQPHLIAKISFIRSANDAPQFSDEYQRELEELIKELKATDASVSPSYDMHAAAGISGGLNGDVKVLLEAGSAIGTIVAAWLHGRYGRRAKLKVGDTEAEASTPQEVKELFKQAEAFKQATEPKRIHEQ
jgi:hypothetical protein